MPLQYVTDGGLETDLVFNRGFDLPEFAAFPLLDSAAGREALRDYYLAYVDIAVRAGVAVLLETPTWRANPDHASLLGYDAAATDRVNRESVAFLAALADERDELAGWRVSGAVGPRGDGYLSDGGVVPEDAADYHRPQLASFLAAGAHQATAFTLTDVGEGIGVARAAADVGIPVVVGFTVETDGRLPDRTSLGDAISAVDADCAARGRPAPASYLINCAHPTHVAKGLDAGPWRERIGNLRVNASTMSHEELDAAEELDAGDPHQLTADQKPLLDAFPNLGALGGCCGTDTRHVAAMWGV